MTAIVDAGEPDVAFRPSGHPVAWFVAVLAAVVAALTLTWWAGLVTARVDVGGAGHSNDEVTGEIDGFDVAVTNRGPLPVRVVGVGLSRSPAVAMPAVRLDPGERTVVHLAVRLGPCRDRRLRVEVRSPAGVVRSLEVGRSRLSGWCPAP